MSRIIFDIETAAKEFDSLDEKVKEYFLKGAKTEEEIQQKKLEINLSPLFGEIVAIALLNPDTGKGRVLYQDKSDQTAQENEAGVLFEALTEKQLLEEFWQTVKSYKQIITFNGRGFDCPYILMRSAFHKISPSKNLMPNRYYPETHLDLLDQMTFYGSFRRYSLDIYCRGLGITSPKENGVDGSMVPELFRQGEYKKIAKYCLGDVKATAGLLAIYEEYILSKNYQ